MKMFRLVFVVCFVVFPQSTDVTGCDARETLLLSVTATAAFARLAFVFVAPFTCITVIRPQWAAAFASLFFILCPSHVSSCCFCLRCPISLDAHSNFIAYTILYVCCQSVLPNENLRT